MTTPTAPLGIAPGVYLQLYRGAIRGNTIQARRERLARYVREIAGMRAQGLVEGVVFHGFCEDLRDSWPRLEALAEAHGVPAGASWGLDSRDLSARTKGDLVGQVLAAQKCRFGLLDAEGQWDSDLGPADDMDEQGALELGEALRRRAPSARVGDQPWYAIEAHGDVRRTARPMGQGGVFRGFPVDEFAVVCDLGRFRQAYIYNAQGAFYRSTFERMDREWTNITPALAAEGLDRPLYVTLQAYRWKLHEQVHALLDRCVRPNAPLILWCDPWPDAVTLAAVKIVQILLREGCAGPGVDARDAVRAWQRSYNATAPENAKIAVDGWAGEDTACAMGIHLVTP